MDFISADHNERPEGGSVVTFLKGGQKKELEVEVAAFVTKWLMDRDVPFGIDFGSCGVDRAAVIELLPKRLQKILGATVPVITETADVTQVLTETIEVVEAGAGEQVAAVEETGEDAGAAEEITEAAEVAAEPSGGDGGENGPSELR